MGIGKQWKWSMPLGRLFVLSAVALQATETTGDEGVTVKGQVVQGESQDLQVDLSKFRLGLKEDLYDKLPKPKYPENWGQMNREQREAYAKKFEASPAGKKMLAEREKILKQANDFDVLLEKSGKFVVYDVPPGTYELRGREDMQVGQYTYAFEVFGQVLVSDDVDEIQLDPVMILATPVFQRGQPAPELALKLFQGQEVVTPASLAGKPIFLTFWSAEFSPPSVEFQPLVQTMFRELKDKHDLVLVSISLDPSRDSADRTIKERGFQGYHGFAPGWEHPVAEAFGVRALPYFLLIGPDGKIGMTHPEIRRAFADGQTLGEMVEQRLTERRSEKGGGKAGRADGGGG